MSLPNSDPLVTPINFKELTLLAINSSNDIHRAYTEYIDLYQKYEARIPIQTYTTFNRMVKKLTKQGLITQKYLSYAQRYILELSEFGYGVVDAVIYRLSATTKFGTVSISAS